MTCLSSERCDVLICIISVYAVIRENLLSWQHVAQPVSVVAFICTSVVST